MPRSAATVTRVVLEFRGTFPDPEPARVGVSNPSALAQATTQVTTLVAHLKARVVAVHTQEGTRWNQNQSPPF